ncbi:clathrin coat assembly protein ap19 [Gonapodya prolifera JEL478]|uniref:AP complex subunit sigma n=1 Tax=Gonapodya prolifera (strain JEL478) TaxID=1344416 RepID=A0A139A2P1_GONPJ|nr:clathrin coat assembly protein ap19 [Gonapodya prolifera JEL478]|eukprot:KXS11032.1 clathrin coat assembly protein ap19 [Gonapodya prolifera JEL478]
MINWFICFSRHGKIRLKRWFVSASQAQVAKQCNEAITLVLARKPSMCNILELREKKLIYRRYASLFFMCCVDFEDNELITLEIIHRYVQILDEHFGNVCELDIVYGMQEAFVILDEIMMNGELVESSKKAVVGAVKKMNSQEQQEATLGDEALTAPKLAVRG